MAKSIPFAQLSKKVKSILLRKTRDVPKGSVPMPGKIFFALMLFNFSVLAFKVRTINVCRFAQSFCYSNNMSDIFISIPH